MRSAPERSAPERSAPDRSAPERSAPERSASMRSAPERSAPERSAPERSAPERSAPERSFPDKFASERSGFIEGLRSLQEFQTSTPCARISRYDWVAIERNFPCPAVIPYFLVATLVT